jgi:hypothetical protein
MSQIDSLTAEQAARLPEFRDRWLSVGLSVQPTDRAKSQEAVCRAYAEAGLPAPTTFVWLASPMQGAFGAAYLAAIVKNQVMDQVGVQVGAQVGAQVWAQVRDQVMDQVGVQVGAQVWAQVRDQVMDQVGVQVGAQVGAQVWAQVRDQVMDQVGDQVWDQVRDQVRDQVWAQVRDQVRDQVGVQVGAQVGAQVWAQVRDQVRDQVWDQVWDQVRDQVRDQVWDQVRDQVRDHVWAACYGLHDAGWLGFYAYFCDVCRLADCERLRPLMDLAEWCGWWWPFRMAVILTEKPIRLARDARGRLHCEDKAAIEYGDGWGVHAWHGVRVPADVITAPEGITPKRIDEEKNAEIRRVMLERYGVSRYVLESKAEVLHEDVDLIGQPRRLLRRRFPDGRAVVLVHVKNSTLEPDGTRKDYFLRVHPELRPLPKAGGTLGEPQKMTARNAVASTYGRRGEDYGPAMET